MNNWGADQKAYTYDFKWSNSRNNAFEECLRKYFLQFYEVREWWESDNSSIKRISHVMKNLKSRAMWRGVIVHEVIRVIINNHLMKNAEFDYDHADEILTRKMKNDWKSSVDWLNVDDPKVFCGLAEHYYDMKYCDYDGYLSDLEDARMHIRAFYDSGLLNEIMRPGMKIIELEKLRDFSIGSIPVLLKIDLALQDSNGNISVTDWKTGQLSKTIDDETINEDITDDALQLNLYALYVSANYKIHYDRIFTQQINLAGRKSLPFKITSESIKATTNKVVQSANEMLIMDKRKNSIDNFPQKQDSHRCRSCNFRGICFSNSYPFPRHWRKENLNRGSILY